MGGSIVPIMVDKEKVKQQVERWRTEPKPIVLNDLTILGIVIKNVPHRIIDGQLVLCGKVLDQVFQLLLERERQNSTATVIEFP